MKCITESSGIVFVYSNLIRGGVLQFAMALEEAGFEPALSTRMLETTSGEYSGPSRGKYAFLTSDMKEKQIEQLIRRLRRPENSQGQDIRIILGSPLVSEGIDFKNIRQIHILDPWYNMSRMEQIIGRGLRTCSHSGLSFEDQNCTVYLHTTRYLDSTQETYDEYMYRVYIEEKAYMIAKVKRIITESAIDCSSQIASNMLPDLWRELIIPQRRAQDKTILNLPLSAMSAPTFEDGTPGLVCTNFTASSSEDYVRPLGTYFDIKDDVFDQLIEMFSRKQIWSIEDLIASKGLKYAPEVVKYLLQDAIHTHLKLKDSNGRIGVLENREGLYVFVPSDDMTDHTMIERTTVSNGIQRTPIPIEEDENEDEESQDEESQDEEKEDEVIEKKSISLDQIKTSYTFPFDASQFSDEVKLWFIIDQKLPHDQKVELLKSIDRSAGEQPIWARGLIVDGPNFLAISPSQILNTENVSIEPIGPEKDSLKLWIGRHIDSLVYEIRDENKIMCTVEDQTLKVAAFEVVDNHVSRIK